MGRIVGLKARGQDGMVSGHRYPGVEGWEGDSAWGPAGCRSRARGPEVSRQPSWPVALLVCGPCGGCPVSPGCCAPNAGGRNRAEPAQPADLGPSGWVCPHVGFMQTARAGLGIWEQTRKHWGVRDSCHTAPG